MSFQLRHLGGGLVAFAALSTSSALWAATVDVKVKIENRAPGNSISFAPLHIGFNNGSFDAFDNGSAPSAAIISVAEGGAGGAWQAAFGAADPTAVRSTLGGLLQPGQSFTSTAFRIDTVLNPFFTFASMAVPSNDFFIGNDDPMRYRLFDAAFVGNNDLRTAQNGVVSFNFSELTGFNGLTTGAGYVFDSQLAAETDVYRISFQVTAVPEPETYALMLAGLAAVGWVARRRSARPQDRVLTAA